MTLALAKDDFQGLIDLLHQQGYQVMGPTLGEGAVVYEEISSVDQLPIGWIEEQEAGRYRLVKDEAGRWFGHTVGPHSLKRLFHPPTVCLWKARRAGRGFNLEEPDESPPRYAFLGARACELAAVLVQDRVFLGQGSEDRTYKLRREEAFIVGVECPRAGGTCFCVSMGTGPDIGPEAGDDLTLTELEEVFLVRARTPAGDKLLGRLPTRPATPEEQSAAVEQRQQVRGQMGRHLETEGLPQALLSNLEHPRWDEVAERCLTCANCTMVCPTCFCFTVEDVTDLTGENAERVRHWDSCFTTDFTYTAGHPARSSTKSRYRQWLTHKLATWHDQFGSSGCVGCGRCITWCPVGIDITEEAAAVAAGEEEPGGSRARGASVRGRVDGPASEESPTTGADGAV